MSSSVREKILLPLLLSVIVTVMVTLQPVSASSTLVITPSTPMPNVDFTISGQFTGIGGGVGVSVLVYVGSGCTGQPLSNQPYTVTSNSPPGSWSVIDALSAGLWSVQAVDFNDASACVNFNVSSSSPIPVGGVVTSVNTLAVLAPWLAVIGLVGCLGTVVAVAKPWKKPEN